MRGLPLVRLSLILPIVRELDRRRVDVNAVLASSGLARERVADQDVFVPPIVVHRFLEEAAQAAGDRYLCARVGETLDERSWPPLADAASRATTLAGFLIRFIRAAADDASSAQHALEVGPRLAVFREKRTSEQEIDPAQNDAFTAAYTLRLVRRGAGPRWSPEEVWLTVCDPAALPERYMGVHVARGDRKGMTIRFPSAWLLDRFDREGFLESASTLERGLDVPTGFLQALRLALEPHLHDANLGVEFVVQLLGTSRQSLQRKLRAHGTTLSTEIRRLKQDRATTDLVRSDRRISEIAWSLGFQDPTSFTRAFRSWTGESPREYRRQRRTL
jgi:AraC-like DNA-binding protein